MQRKGQFLWNSLSGKDEYPEEVNELVGQRLWNLSDIEFDNIMEKLEIQRGIKV